jgi:enoyl-CoA hydratase
MYGKKNCYFINMEVFYVGVVEFHKEEHVAYLTINNPPLNVLSKEVIDELIRFLELVKADDDVRVLVITGEGNKAFMAGADIKGFPTLLKEKRAGAAKASTLPSQGMLKALDNLPKPTIAAINGMALGAGCELALACDFRICTESAQFGLPEVKLGLIPGGGGTQRLPRLIGASKAKEMMYLGDPISAYEAKEIGLVNQVVPSDKLVSTVKELSSKLASRSGAAISNIKEAVDRGLQVTLEEGLNIELDLFDRAFLTEDGQEGVTAFLEKRKPVFKHK